MFNIKALKNNSIAYIELHDNTEIKIRGCSTYHKEDSLIHFNGDNNSLVVIPENNIKFFKFNKEN